MSGKSFDILKHNPGEPALMRVDSSQIKPNRVCGSIIVLRGEGADMETLVGQIECVNTLRSTPDVMVLMQYICC
jgi:hypothetical protein